MRQHGSLKAIDMMFVYVLLGLIGLVAAVMSEQIWAIGTCTILLAINVGCLVVSLLDGKETRWTI